MYRVLKPDSFCVSFYGWNQADKFLAAWRAAGFRIVGHFTFPKWCASSTGMVKYQHENAYLLAKGYPREPRQPIGDVIPWTYTGNTLHPTQKPIEILKPLIANFSEPGDLVLDPFCGSGSCLLSARILGRNYLGIELDRAYCATAQRRLEAFEQHCRSNEPIIRDTQRHPQWQHEPQHHSLVQASHQPKRDVRGIRQASSSNEPGRRYGTGQPQKRANVMRLR